MSSQNRPTASSCDQLLLDLLWDLSIRLKTNQPGNSMLERYNYFIRSSDRGRACTYAMKCKQLFYTYDYQEVKELLKKINDIVDMIDNENKTG